MKVKNESEVVQSCLTLRDPMDCSLPGSSIHGIFLFLFDKPVSPLLLASGMARDWPDARGIW